MRFTVALYMSVPVLAHGQAVLDIPEQPRLLPNVGAPRTVQEISFRTFNTPTRCNGLLWGTVGNDGADYSANATCS